MPSALRDARSDLGFLRLDPAAWAGVCDISIDDAVMEKSNRLLVVPFRAAWSDLGDWESVLHSTPGDAAGVALSDHVTTIDCHDTLLRADGGAVELVGIGLDGIIAVAMPTRCWWWLATGHRMWNARSRC